MFDVIPPVAATLCWHFLQMDPCFALPFRLLHACMWCQLTSLTAMRRVDSRFGCIFLIPVISKHVWYATINYHTMVYHETSIPLQPYNKLVCSEANTLLFHRLVLCVRVFVCLVTWDTGRGSPSLQQTSKRRPRCAVRHFILWVALHYCTVLIVTVPAATFSVAALLGAHCIAAAVVTEGTPTQSGKTVDIIKLR